VLNTVSAVDKYQHARCVPHIANTVESVSQRNRPASSLMNRLAAMKK
jgi:hypothetical protein